MSTRTHLSLSPRSATELSDMSFIENIATPGTMKAKDVESAALDMVGSFDEARALELIRQAANWMHAALDGDFFFTMEWNDDLNLRDRAALVWVMQAMNSEQCDREQEY